MKTLIACLILVVSVAQAHEIPDLRSELDSLYETDQALRSRLQEVILESGFESEEGQRLWQVQQAIDEANFKRIEKIVGADGWPDRRVLGDKASMAVFLIVQHAAPEQQKRFLPVLREAVAEGKARAQDLALLEDRVLMSEGNKQLYGSQLQEDGQGGWTFYPIEDEANVDRRREAVGLPPLSEYAKAFGLAYPRQ